MNQLRDRSSRHLWRGIALCGAVGLALAVWLFRQPVGAALWAHSYFAATDLVIRGAGPLLSDDDVVAWIGVDDETTLWELAPLRVRARLEEHPLVAWASVRREFPNRLFIRVHERRPEAIALLDRIYYLDRNGHVLGPLTPRYSRDYPVITGLTLEMTPGHRAWVHRRAVRLARLCARVRCLGGLSEIHVAPETGGLVVYPRYPRVAIRLGWGSWREKLDRAERVLQASLDRIDQIVAIDLRYRNQVVVAAERPLAAEQAPAGLKNGARARRAAAAGDRQRLARPQTDHARADHRRISKCAQRSVAGDQRNTEWC